MAKYYIQCGDVKGIKTGKKASRAAFSLMSEQLADGNKNQLAVSSLVYVSEVGFLHIEGEDSSQINEKAHAKDLIIKAVPLLKRLGLSV